MIINVRNYVKFHLRVRLQAAMFAPLQLSWSRAGEAVVRLSTVPTRDFRYAPRYESHPEAPHPESDGSVTQATPPPLKRPHPVDKQSGSSSSHGSPHEQLCRHQPQPEDQQVSSRSEASDAPHSAMVAGVSAPAVGAHGCSWRVGQCSANASFAGAGQRLQQ